MFSHTLPISPCIHAVLLFRLALWRNRSPHDLLGAHVDLRTGQWTQADAGIGRGIDSFYEYMLKAHMLFGDVQYLAIFHDIYYAALEHLKHGAWYIDAHVLTAQVTWPLFNSLQCFWPGLQFLMGEVELGVDTLRAFHALWLHVGFHPEGFNLATLEVQEGQASFIPIFPICKPHFHYVTPLCFHISPDYFFHFQAGYPLRPEHAESLFYAHRTTHGVEWLEAGK